MTGHRRENFDGGLARVCTALKDIARRGDVEIVYPVHLNPEVQKTANAILDNDPAIRLIAPLDYVSFIVLMRRAYLIVTDSGGIQEEAPGLGKPVLVTRDGPVLRPGTRSYARSWIRDGAGSPSPFCPTRSSDGSARSS